MVYTPNSGFTGTDSFAYTISDGMGGLDTATVTVTVNPAPNASPDATNDTASTIASTPISVAVLGNDSDPNGDPLTVTAATPGTNGSTSISTNGTTSPTDDVVVYTPNSGFTGTDSFTYTISDGMGGLDTATVTVTVNPAPNASPDATNDTASTIASTPISVAVLGNDSDPNGDPLTVTAATPGTNGSTSISTNGTTSPTDDVVVYTPNSGFTGTDSFTYTISDGMGGLDTATVTVVVNNGIPDAVNDATSTPSGTPVSIGVLGNDSDPNGDPLTVTAATPGTNGSTSISTNGTTSPTDDVVVYTPNSGFTGTDSFTYTISDGMGGLDTATVTVTVNPAPNAAPDATNDTASTIASTPISVAVLGNDSDPNGDPLTVTAATPGTNGSTSISTNGTTSPTDDVVVYTPNSGFTGTDSFTYTISDGMGGLDTATVTVTVTGKDNNPPDAVKDYATSDGMPIRIDVLANDTDPDGDKLTITNITDGTNGKTSIDTKGTTSPTDDVVVYTPDPGFHGTDKFTYTISDGMGGLDTATVKVTVTGNGNDSPDAVNDSATSDGMRVRIDVLANDTDPDGDPLTITSVSDGTNGTTRVNTKGTPSPTDDVVVYRPNSGFTGTDSFTYTISDGMGGLDTATVTVKVIGEDNDPPDAVNDSATSDGMRVRINVLVNDTDPDGDPLTITSVSDGTNGTTRVNTKGTPSPTDDVVVYRPNSGFTGTDSFTYTISDGMGGFDTATVTVKVIGEDNDPPDAVNDSATSDGMRVRIDVLANDTDPDGDPLTITSVSDGTNGTTRVNTKGTPSPTDDVVVYRPNSGFTGTDSFTYTISDGMGGFDTATVKVTVTGGDNDPPDAVNDYATSDGMPVKISVLANDTDPDGDKLTITNVTDGMNGKTSVDTKGTTSPTDDVVIYTPDPGFSGTDKFTYTISDGMGGFDTATVKVTVTGGDNDPPDAVNDYATSDGMPVKIAVLANDTDPDGDKLTITNITDGTNGKTSIDTKGTASPTDDVVVYTPNSGFSGTDKFTYTISDGMGGLDTATVKVVVAPCDVNQPPDAVNDSATSDGMTVKIAVLANDTDSDGDKLTITSVTDSMNGTTAIDSKGTASPTDDVVLYTPDPGFSGTDRFTYTISDGMGGFDTATVCVKVTPCDNGTNQRPDAVNDSASANGTAVSIAVLRNDTDPDGDKLTITDVTPGMNGTTRIDTKGTSSTTDDVVVYMPSSGFRGTDKFTYTISDGMGGLDTATVTITCGS